MTGVKIPMLLLLYVSLHASIKVERRFRIYVENNFLSKLKFVSGSLY